MKTIPLATSLILSAYAISSFAAVQQPTPSSKPLPTMEATRNIDTVLSEKVQSEIVKNSTFRKQAITAASNEQVVTLQGSVDSKEMEAEAVKIAKSVPGVKEVKSQLTIKLTPSQP